MRSLLVLLFVACDSSGSVGPVELVPDTAVLCDFSTCADDDPCTDDLCQLDGSCLHVARNPFAACQTDAHCDDQNPCTIDACVKDDCQLDRCTNTFIAGCRPCDFGCDDGVDCTDDTCGADGLCKSTARDESCEVECSPTFAQSINMAQWNGPFSNVTRYFGTARPADGVNCTGGACRCEVEAVLEESGFAVPLADGEDGEGGEGGEGYACQVDACGATVSCAPMLAGVRYIVWGDMRYLDAHDSRSPTPDPQTVDTFANDAGASVDIALPQPIDRFDVRGFCLPSDPFASTGNYRGRIESGGKTATFDAVIVDMTLHTGACDGCEALGLVDQAASVYFGFSSLTVSIAFSDGVRTVQLFPSRNTFRGDLNSDAGNFFGTLTLERVAN